MPRSFRFDETYLGAVWVQVSREQAQNRVRLVVSVARSWDVGLTLTRDAARELASGLAGPEPQTVHALDEDEKPASLTAAAGSLTVRVPDDNLDERVELGTDAAAIGEALVNAATPGHSSETPVDAVGSETTNRLLWHAGLRDVPGPGLSRSIAACTSPTSQLEGLDEAVADFITAMARLNNELNGAAPSQTRNAGASAIPRTVAYAVSEVSRFLREHDPGDHHDVRASQAARQVDAAWNAVLAGDIDDIAQYLRDEQRLRPSAGPALPQPRRPSGDKRP